MAELTDNLTRFLEALRLAASRRELLAEDLRFPEGGQAIFRGSALGASLWSTPEGAALLNIATNDPGVQAAFAGNWNPLAETRMVLASVVMSWLASGMPTEEFAHLVEAGLWNSLRRPDIVASAVGIVEGIISPAEGIVLPYGCAIMPPDEDIMSTAFSPAWPSYNVYLPSVPFSLFVARVSVPRSLFSGIAAPVWARIALDMIRDAVWLTTGGLAKFGHVVTWEEHRFPISLPEHYPPQVSSNRIEETVELAPFLDELPALFGRLAVLGGSDLAHPTLEMHTEATLRTLRAQLDAVISSADDVIPLLFAFSAADGSLREVDEPNDVVPARFSLLCGSGDVESRHLRRMLQTLDPIRDRVAHGDRPTNEEIAKFLTASGTTPEGDGGARWFPQPWDRSQRVARAKALDLLRRLYKAWLMVALRFDGERVEPGLTRAQLIDLLRGAQRGQGDSLRILRKLTSTK